MIDNYVPPPRRKGNFLLKPDLACLDAFNTTATRGLLQSSGFTRWKSSYASKLDASSPNLVVTSNTETCALPSNSSTYKYSLLKKMWMLYAEQQWTKAIDLKSAVERLYENLGALEFHADNKSIYGMEIYYTVEQCEQLRDKYKIGRKLCGQFLKGKYCSQYLKDRLSKIGIQHFLGTINKSISNSDTSDEEEYKSVEQNGQGSGTTKEESKRSNGERITKTNFIV
ncbi:hypothetical protein FQA39_LY16219 [Lamprigera yunnana]|nr:hypothetical protein FQA39_LY16219 [Lamprigera yunnana]